MSMIGTLVKWGKASRLHEIAHWRLFSSLGNLGGCQNVHLPPSGVLHGSLRAPDPRTPGVKRWRVEIHDRHVYLADLVLKTEK